MEFEKLRDDWRRRLEQTPAGVDSDRVARLVEQYGLNFERTIRRRDIVESTVAAVVIVLFGLSAAAVPTLTGKFGSLIVVAGAILVIWTLWRARTAALPPSPSLPLADFLARQREQVLRQIALLKSVAWWYLAPILLGVNLVFWAQSQSVTASLCYLAGTLAFGLFVWWLNQRAIRAHLQPMLEEIDRLVAQLNSDDRADSGAT